MPRIIFISTQGDIDTAVKTLDGIERNLPQMTREGMRKWGTVLVRDLRTAAKLAGIKPMTGTLLGSEGIRWEQNKRSDIGFLWMRRYGLALDHMIPHFVNVTRRRTRLLAWAKLANRSWISRKARMVDTVKSGRKGTIGVRYELSRFSIWVEPHPFIRNGYNMARPKLGPILKRTTQRAVETS